MNSMKVKDAMAAANADAPAGGGGGGGAWEDAAELPVEIVNANVNTSFEVPRIGLHLENSETGRRRWFDLYFDEKNARSFRMTGLKLKALGLEAIIDQLDAAYPDDTQAQLEGIAAAMRGIKFVAKIEKVEANATKNDRSLPDADRKYVNYFNVVSMTEGPSTVAAPAAPAAVGFGGLMG